MLKRILSSAYTAYVIMLVFVLFGQYVANQNEKKDIARNKAAIASVVEERDQARTFSCLQYNDTQKVQIQAEIKQSHDFVTALVGSNPSPETVKRALDFNVSHDVLIRSEHAPRDCSRAGIAKYLKGVGPPITTPRTTTTTKSLRVHKKKP